MFVWEPWVRPFFSFSACVSLIIHRYASSEDGHRVSGMGATKGSATLWPFRLYSQPISFGDQLWHHWKFERHLFEHKQATISGHASAGMRTTRMVNLGVVWRSCCGNGNLKSAAGSRKGKDERTVVHIIRVYVCLKKIHRIFWETSWTYIYTGVLYHAAPPILIQLKHATTSIYHNIRKILYRFIKNGWIMTVTVWKLAFVCLVGRLNLMTPCNPLNNHRNVESNSKCLWWKILFYLMLMNKQLYLLHMLASICQRKEILK